MLDKIAGGNLSQNVVSRISRMILDGTIKKGDMLPSEAKLCEQLGVSRTTVRSALKILAQRNIITTQQGKGSFVITDNFPYLGGELWAKIDEYGDNFIYAVQVRRMLEPQIAFEAACHATDEDIAKLDEVVKDCREKDAEGTLTTADMRLFHIRLAEIQRNHLLLSLVQTLISMCDAPPDSEINVPNPRGIVRTGVMEEHEEILNAIREHRPGDAYYLMKKNIQSFENNCLDEF